ncbi:uncharacterized protein LOC132565355 [Ylistrum balloti]|uniref:uncharacterized protein LOC132565355 n=1 Tax=Ylistrum balloti TaxID=509963 RepID=UPI002905F3F6|nr:uncharacterized protein LOC132565355 [Ylistrum balloti]
MGEAGLNEVNMLSSYEESPKLQRLKRTMKDKCLVIGETTMYYGNFGSVQVMTPIPGSPNLDNESEIANIPKDYRNRPTEADVPPQQPELQAILKKEKKLASERRKNTTVDKKKAPKYALPPLKAPSGATNSRGPQRASKGRTPCHFQPTNYTNYIDNTYFLGSSEAWIPQPGFKPSDKKIMPKNNFTSKSSSLKNGSLSKLIESTKRVQGPSSLETSSSASFHLPAIHGTSTSVASQTSPQAIKYINIYKDDGHLPPLKVSTMSIANRRIEKEHYKVTKSFQW